MSHSFALCAAAIFSNAARASLCAAARLGCRPGLTFLTGFPATTKPPVSASTVTAMIKIFFMGPPLEAGIIPQGRLVQHQAKQHSLLRCALLCEAVICPLVDCPVF